MVVIAAPLPDSYFTPTVADLMSAQSQLAARTQAMVNAPLQLRATREAGEKAKRDRWPNVRDPLPPTFAIYEFLSFRRQYASDSAIGHSSKRCSHRLIKSVPCMRLYVDRCGRT